jgi:zinc-ribbon domain
VSAVEASGANWIALASPGQTYRFCANWEHECCNWMVTPEERDALCAACRHNRTIPDISNPIHFSRWQKIEAAKRIHWRPRAFGLRTRPEVPDGDVLRARIDFDPYRCRNINQIIDVWLPLKAGEDRARGSGGDKLANLRKYTAHPGRLPFRILGEQLLHVYADMKAATSKRAVRNSFLLVAMAFLSEMSATIRRSEENSGPIGLNSKEARHRSVNFVKPLVSLKLNWNAILRRFSIPLLDCGTNLSATGAGICACRCLHRGDLVCEFRVLDAFPQPSQIITSGKMMPPSVFVNAFGKLTEHFEILRPKIRFISRTTKIKALVSAEFARRIFTNMAKMGAFRRDNRNDEG